MPGGLSLCYLPTAHEIDAIIVPVLYLRKLRHLPKITQLVSVGIGFAPKLSDSTWNTWKYSLIKYRQHHKPVRQSSSFYSWHCGNHHVLSSFMMFQDSFFYRFLPFAILLRKFCWWTNFLSFPLSQNVLISPLFLKDILLGIGVQVDSFNFKHLKNIVLLPWPPWSLMRNLLSFRLFFLYR